MKEQRSSSMTRKTRMLLLGIKAEAETTYKTKLFFFFFFFSSEKKIVITKRDKLLHARAHRLTYTDTSQYAQSTSSVS
jgi:hypothetical protein